MHPAKSLVSNASQKKTALLAIPGPITLKITFVNPVDKTVCSVTTKTTAHNATMATIITKGLATNANKTTAYIALKTSA